ncbi:MAG TPA: hypothetical protein VNW51_06715 [Mucilaginibacter sp.]|jgi:hypothetical protein|nr:hypothetical protein [Mucilaginibacter sp.]
MTTKLIGVFLTVIGLFMIFWTSFTYTRKEKILKAGPVEISADREHTVNWPPYMGGILVVGGIIVLVTARKSK